MPLTRKTRNSGSSIVVTIPCQLIEAYDIHFGDSVQIIPLKNGEIKIKKIDTDKYIHIKIHFRVSFFSFSSSFFAFKGFVNLLILIPRNSAAKKNQK